MLQLISPKFGHHPVLEPFSRNLPVHDIASLHQYPKPRTDAGKGEQSDPRSDFRVNVQRDVHCISATGDAL